MKKYFLTLLIPLGFAGLLVVAIVFFTRGELARTKANLVGDPKLLTATERQEITQKLISSLDADGARAAILQLRNLSLVDARVLRSCHPLVHELGHAAYKKYTTFTTAMEFRDEFCNSGYIHGVIEAHFSEGIDRASLITLCDADQGLRAWECWHGVGHGLMFATENNLPESLAGCDALPSDEARGACQNGVFMENFNSNDESHPSNYRRVDAPLYPCADQAPKHRGNCYLYAPSYYLALHPGEYETAFTICRAAPSDGRSDCVAGVGAEIAKQHLDSLARAVHWCNLEELGADAGDCVGGFIGYLYFHVGTQKQEGQELCQQLSGHSRRLCNRVMTDGA